jgi:hypothetical protein
MTQGEFAQGWKLLILQPWGWRYRGLNEEGQPTEEAKLQMQLYYSKLKWASPEAWMKVVSVYVEGSEWPSIGDMKRSLQQANPEFVKAIEGPGPAKAERTMTDDEARSVLKRFGITMP